MSPAEPKPPQPHHDPNAWSRLVDNLDIAAIFVAIGAWIGHEHRSRIAVEDIWQETLWLAWRDRQQHDWNGIAPYRSWLLGIARHRVDDACRRAGRHKRAGTDGAAAFTDLAADSVSGYLPPQSTTPSRVAGHRERAMVMERALATLDEPLQQVVRLRLFEELPTRVVADQLSIPLSTVKERLVRGVQRYRELLAGLLRGDSISDDSSAAT